MSAAFRFETGSASHVGCVRQRNEDNCLTAPDFGLWAVADGMGGHDAGDRASEAVVRALASVGRPLSAPDLLSRVQDRLIRAHFEMKEIAREQQAETVGATVVALLVYGTFFACVWSGDSRLYRVRERRLEQVSTDHSEVAELVGRGVLTAEEARTWSGRNAITRAVGVYDELELEVLHGEVRTNDVFVLCSDGLTDHVEDWEILHHVVANMPERACHQLVDLALQRGGRDNVTVVVVACKAQTVREKTVYAPPGMTR